MRVALFNLLELKQALRRLRREPGFAFTALITLALCIGANIAIFAVVNTVLIKPLPFKEPDRLVNVLNRYPGAGVERAGASYAGYWERREDLKSFEYQSIIQEGSAVIGEAGAPKRVSVDRVSPEFFDLLGVPLLKGRSFQDDEMVYDNWLKAVLTYSFWQNYFDGDPDVLGKTIQVDRQTVTVVGVLPEGFEYPMSEALFFMPAARSAEERSPEARHSNNFQCIGRLAPGVSVEAAQAEIDAYNTQQVEEDPYRDLLLGAQFQTSILPLREDYVRDVSTMLWLLQGGAFCLLLIGAVNLANLFLVRANGRVKERAVCQALGASRRHVAREVLLETLLVTMSGGVLGLVSGYFGIKLLSRLGASELPLGGVISMDTRVVVVCMLASLLLGVALALPILAFSLKQRLAPILHSVSRGGTSGRAAQKVRYGFIVVQIGLAFVLLVSAGMMSLSLHKVMQEDPGFDRERVMTAQLNLPWESYRENADRRAFLNRLLLEAGSIPGISHVGAVTSIPFGNSFSNNATAVEGFEADQNDVIRAHFTIGVMGDYFEAMGIRLVKGRYLDEADNEGDTRHCVVDTDFANRYWPDGDAIGKRITSGPEFSEEECMTIVGVVESIQMVDLTNEDHTGAIYMPYRLQGWNNVSLVFSTLMPPSTLTPALRDLVASLDPAMPLEDVRTMGDRVDDSLEERRSPTLLAGIFAVVALLLASIGTYGVLAYAATQRRREIGVRVALGARPLNIKSQFFWLGLKLAAAGSTLGLAGSWLAGKAMQSLLYEMPSLDLRLVILTGATLGVVSLLACLLPALKAARVSPMIALRTE